MSVIQRPTGPHFSIKKLLMVRLMSSSFFMMIPVVQHGLLMGVVSTCRLLTDWQRTDSPIRSGILLQFVHHPDPVFLHDVIIITMVSEQSPKQPLDFRVIVATYQ